MTTISKNLILITRPAVDADEFARDIRVLGFTPLIEPMLGISEMAYDMPDFASYPALVFTSANAVRVFGCPEAARGVPVFAVGDHTAAELRKSGYTKVYSASGDGADLAALVKQKLQGLPHHLLHIRGEYTARPLEETLAVDRIKMDPLVVYTANTEDCFTDKCRAAIENNAVQAVTFFSKRTAGNFIALARQENLLDNLKSIKALCISLPVLECVHAVQWAEAYRTARPDREAMLDLLRNVCVPDKIPK